MSRYNAAYSAPHEDCQDEPMQSAADYISDRVFDGIRPVDRSEIPLGLSVFVGDIHTAVIKANEATERLLEARLLRSIAAMEHAAHEVQEIANEAQVLARVLERKINELRNRDTRVRS